MRNIALVAAAMLFLSFSCPTPQKKIVPAVPGPLFPNSLLTVVPFCTNIDSTISACSSNPKTKEFDFWIGEWNVYKTGTQKIVGHSLVQSISGGCALLENWESNSGNTGKSINYFNTETGKWEQDWMGSDGSPQRYLYGEYKDTAMRFSYETMQNGQKAMGHFIFFNMGEGKVRQFQDISVDGGKTFQTVYDFTYLRKK